MTQDRITSVGELTIDLAERSARFAGADLALTTREFDVLAELCTHPGWVYSPDQLSGAEGGGRLRSPGAVNVHVTHLRAKLAAAGAPGLIATVRGVGWRIRRSSAAAWPSAVASPFIGRARELADITKALRSRPGALVVVTGDAGVGKTALAERALHACEPTLEVIRARCDPNGGGDYGLWRQALAEVERRTGARIAEQPGGHLMVRLLSLAGAPSIAGADRAATYDAVAEYLTATLSTRPRPTAIFVDDLHAADAASAGLLLNLLERGDPVPASFVVTARADAPHGAAIRAVADLAAGRESGLAIRLRGLSTPEVAELARAALGSDDFSLARALEQLTGGNPFYLSQCMRVMRDRGITTADQLGAAPIAVLVASEIERLPPRTRALLVVAAVAGVEFEPEVIIRARSGATDGDLEPAFDAGVLIDAGHARARFRHALVRDAVLAPVSLPDRQKAHAEVAAALERSDVDRMGLAARLAHHYASAGPTHARRALGHTIAAARSSTDSFAFEDSAHHLEIALTLLPRAGLPRIRERRVKAAVLERLGGVASAQGGMDDAVRHYEGALAARPHEDALARTRLLTKIGAAHALARRAVESEHAFSGALAALSGLGARDADWWRELMEVRLAQTLACEMLDAPLPFDLEAELALPMREHGTPPLRAKHLIHLSAARAAHERWIASDATIDLARRAVAEAAASGNDFLKGYAAESLGGLLAMRGDAVEAEVVLRSALGITRYCADSLGEAASLLFLGMAARARGDVHSTESLAQELAAVAERRAPLPEFRSGVLADRGWVALRRGDPALAARLCDEALALWDREPASTQGVWLMAWPALACALARGDVARACEYAALMTRPGQQRLLEDLDQRLGEAVELHAQGDDADARALLEELTSVARSFGYA